MKPVTHVRPAVPGDIPRILEIEREAEAAAHFSEADYQRALASDNTEAEVRRIVLVAGTPELVQGFLVARFLQEEWEIENVAVTKGARRLGFGARLVGTFLRLSICSTKRIENSGAEAAAVFLEVRESNLAARRLYEKFGFTIAGSRTAYYRNPEEDAILYRYSFQ